MGSQKTVYFKFSSVLSTNLTLLLSFCISILSINFVSSECNQIFNPIRTGQVVGCSQFNQVQIILQDLFTTEFHIGDEWGQNSGARARMAKGKRANVKVII